MAVLLTVLVWLTFGYVTSRVAIQRGRDPTMWFGLGMLGGIFALAAVFIMPVVEGKEMESDSTVAQLEKEEADSEFEEAHWFFLGVDDQQKGPVEYKDLLMAWDDGVVKESTYVWYHGMEEWQRVSDIPGLFDKLRLDQKHID